MKEIKSIKATDEYVVLKMHTKKTGDAYKKHKSGLLLPNVGQKDEVGTSSNKIELDFAEIFDIGTKVKDPAFKVGDHVIFNEYDIKYVGSAENMYGVLKAANIMAIYESGDEVEE